MGIWLPRVRRLIGIEPVQRVVRRWCGRWRGGVLRRARPVAGWFATTGGYVGAL